MQLSFRIIITCATQSKGVCFLLCLLSSVGIYQNQHFEIIPNKQRNLKMLSYVAFSPEDIHLIDDAAKKQQFSNSQNIIFDVKRLMGRTWDDPQL